MSVELMVEVLKHAPATLNPTERLTLVTIAESCRTETRTTFYRDGWDADELARRVGVNADSLTKVFRSLATKGCEVRVAHAVKNGKPVFAFKGKQTTFLLPRFAPQSPDESPPFVEREGTKARTSVRESPDDSPPNEPQSPDERPPLLLKDLPSRNTSSLSPRGDDSAASPPTDLEPERENVDASQEQPEPRNPIARLLIKNGCPDHLTDHVRDRLAVVYDIHSDGWYFTADRNGSLAPAVAAALEDLDTTPARSCKECHDTGTAGDWMNARPCDCLWWKDPGAARKAFVAKLGDYAECEHGVAGGDMKAPNGWQHCSLCRGPGWVDKDVQPRTDKTTNNRRYEPWHPPADQSAYDRPFSGQVRSPADQRVADGQALYDHYKRLEESA